MKKKISLKPGDMLAPLPCVLVTCSDGKEDNVLTIAWTGIINSEPPMTYISVRPTRHSYAMIKKSREFVINLASEELVKALDYCGCRTGAKENKFESMGLTKIAADKVSCPMIAESPINLECKVTTVKKLGSHDMFMAEIVAVHVDQSLMQKSGRVAFEKANLVSYIHGEYFGSKPKRLGFFGFSVMKPKTAKRRKV
ncbi:MAG: flavin reductase family protein [Bacillota bacterium]|nr:flavin reductase family protein [Bacillota bacterium]